MYVALTQSATFPEPVEGTLRRANGTLLGAYDLRSDGAAVGY